MGMYNLLEVEVICPRCEIPIVTQAELKLGLLALAEYKLGDYLQWSDNGRGLRFPKTRPLDGNMEGEAYVECPNCNKDFWLKVSIQADRISSVQVDVTRKGYIF